MNKTKQLPMLPAFVRKEDGNTTMLFGLMVVPMLYMVGAALDVSRATSDQSFLQNLLDAASIAAVTEYNTNHNATAANQRLNSYVQAGLANSNLLMATDSHRGLGSVTLTNATINTATGSVAPTASVQVPTGALSLAGFPSLPVSVTSSAGLSTSGNKIEIGMMIDLTGSMGDTRNGQTKIAALQSAGQNLIGLLYPNGDNANVRIGIASMADYVNAGPYAAKVTGQAATGAYAPATNLGQTKQGTYYGTYSGVGGGGNGQGFGATGSNSAQAGATYSNGYCSNPNSTYTFTDDDNRKHTVPVGTPAWGYWGQNNGQNTVRYGQFAWQDRNGDWRISEEDDQAYIPAAAPGCSSTPAPVGPLITCVTERTATHADPYGDGLTDAYDDADPTAVPVGAYNKGSPGSVSQYSSDGKCNVAGRELPAVIPLTSSKSTLTTYFANTTIGGGTPGHIGTAWAWYLVSPNWASVWPVTSAPVAYGTPGVKKAVIIMTDGEYNEQYSNVSSRTQALALCTKMKAAGVTVFTVGFGFSTGASDAASLTMLQQCASSPQTTFVPYDGPALTAAFGQIASQLTTSASQVVVQQ